MNIIEDFLTVNSAAQILETLDDHCRELGFEYCVYSPLIGGGNAEKVFKDESRVLESDALVQQNTLINCPQSWLHRYQQARHADHDPVMKHVSRSMLPIFWDDASRPDPKNVVMNEAREHGLVFGVTVSIYGHGGQRALFSASTNNPGKLPQERRTTTAALIQLTSHYVHEALQRVNDKRAQEFPPLSVREKDCLQWAACGKTSWEIAQILTISERTVIFHLGNAAKKLQTTNRRQAVVRALSLRLINP